MADEIGALSRRRLLGAGAAVGATALAGSVRAAMPAAADPLPAAAPPADPPADPAPAGGLAPAGAAESRFYPGITLMAGNELAVATSTVFVKDPFNGSYPSGINGYVGTSLDVPAGSTVHDVVFFLYQQPDAIQQLCAVQLYHPGGAGLEVLLSHTASGEQVFSVSTATESDALPRLLAPDDALCAFVWRGQQTSVCRGIRVDYTPPGGIIGSAGGSIAPIPPARVYDSRLGGGKLRPNEERTISLATALSGTAVVPSRATAAAVTLTVTETEGSGGYVAVFPGGGTWSGTSSINWFGPNQNLATAAIVALGPNLDIVLHGGANATNVVVDVTGYVL
jgi:hypothetical protein